MRSQENQERKKYYLHFQICVLLIGLIISTFCHGQTNAKYAHIFRCGLKDKSGNLWFGTTGEGIYRYEHNPGVFTNFTERDGLCGNTVNSIYESKAGTIWLGTSNGVCCFSPDSGRFINSNLMESPGNDVECILEDRNGNFWFGTNGHGIFYFQSSTKIFTNFTTKDGLSNNYVQCMQEDKTGNIWFGTRGGGLSRYNSAKEFTNFTFEDCIQNQIMDILEDKNGNLWFCNLYGGVCRYSPTSGLFAHFSEENGLCNNIITCILEDKSGNIWFGSDVANISDFGGACRYSPATGEFTNFNKIANFNNIGVWNLVEDNDGNIWIGSREGLFQYSTTLNRFANFTYKLNKQ